MDWLVTCLCTVLTWKLNVVLVVPGMLVGAIEMRVEEVKMDVIKAKGQVLVINGGWLMHNGRGVRVNAVTVSGG